MKKNRRVALYLRVSTKEQSNLNQFRQLRQAAEYHGWNIVAVFRDHGHSGKNTKRPAFKALQKFIRDRRRPVDLVAIWSLSRIGRSFSDLVQFLDDDLRVNDIELFSLNDNIDTSTASGRMIYHILSAVAEYEREHTREKILAALERAKAQGKKLGAPGLNSPKNRRYNPDLIPTIKKHHADGVPIRKIVRLVGLARNTVKAILKESSQTEAEHEAS